MKCGKCSVDIPSSFEFAIKQNVCPKCGLKLMSDATMKVFFDLKQRLQEVELTMNPSANYERLALFLISNYEITPAIAALQVGEDKPMSNGLVLSGPEEELIQPTPPEPEESEEDIRREIADEAEKMRIARDWGMDTTGPIDEATQKRIEKLRSMAQRTAKSGAAVRRTSED